MAKKFIFYSGFQIMDNEARVDDAVLFTFGEAEVELGMNTRKVAVQSNVYSTSLQYSLIMKLAERGHIREVIGLIQGQINSMAINKYSSKEQVDKPRYVIFSYDSTVIGIYDNIEGDLEMVDEDSEVFEDLDDDLFGGTGL